MSMGHKQVRKLLRKMGGKTDMAHVERTMASINTSPAEKRARMEIARERGILNKPLDPRTISDPKRWYEGRPLQTQRPAELNDAMRARRESGGDRGALRR